MSSITLNCPCGAILAIPGVGAGKDVRCSRCGRSIALSSFDPQATTQTIVEDWIKFTCTCGKSVKAPKAWAGQVAKCPRCKRKTRLPGEAPVKRIVNDPLAVFFDPSEKDADGPRLSQLDERKPVRQPGKTPAAPSTAPKDQAQAPRSSIVDELDAAFSEVGVNEATMFMEPVTGSETAKDHPAEQEATETLEAVVRTTCVCGKVVKAPIALAGMTGRCPRCGKDVSMPRIPRRNSKSSFPDPAQESGSTNDRSSTVVGFDAISLEKKGH